MVWTKVYLVEAAHDSNVEITGPSIDLLRASTANAYPDEDIFGSPRSLAPFWPQNMAAERATDEQFQFAFIDYFTMSCSQQAVDLYGPFLRQFGDLLPLRIDDGYSYIFHLTTCLDAVDPATEWELGYRGVIKDWKNITFKASVGREPTLFCTPKLLRNRMFLAQPGDNPGFYEQYAESGNTDLRMKLVWDSRD